MAGDPLVNLGFGERRDGGGGEEPAKGGQHAPGALEERVLGGGEDEGVEVGVALGVAQGVAIAGGLGTFLYKGFQARDVLGGEARGEAGGREALDDGAEGVDLFYVVGTHLGEEVAAAGAMDDETIVDQAEEGLANGSEADAESTGDGPFLEALSGAESARSDLLQDVALDAVAEAAL